MVKDSKSKEMDIRFSLGLIENEPSWLKNTRIRSLLGLRDNDLLVIYSMINWEDLGCEGWMSKEQILNEGKLERTPSFVPNYQGPLFKSGKTNFGKYIKYLHNEGIVE